MTERTQTISPEAEIELVGRGFDDDSWERDEWDVALYLPSPGQSLNPSHDRRFLTKFYTGTALGKPTIGDVMQSLFSDAEGVEYESFEEWAESYGYDSDSRKAEAIYRKIEEQTKRLKSWAGDDYDALRQAFAEDES